MSVSSEPSKPRLARRVQLPDVTGLHLDTARVVLKSAGFGQLKIHYEEDYVDDFHIIDMSPGSGILVDRFSEITLRVSRTNLTQYLPRIYQQSATEGSFLRGFLYVVQTVSDRINRRVDNLHELFDPRTTEPEFLPWLASWLAISLNSEWTEVQTRKMLLAATRLFPARGTALCIKEFVRIYSDCHVEIVENDWPFKGFRIGVHSTVGIDTVILPAMNLSHCFIVKLDRSASEVSEDEIIRIHRIIQSQKPAHTSYFLSFSDERATGDMGSFMTIGVGDAIGMGAEGMGMGMEDAAIVEAVAEPEPEPAAKAASPKKTGRKKADTKKADTKKADTKKADTKKADTKKADTKKADEKKSSASSKKAKRTTKSSSTKKKSGK